MHHELKARAACPAVGNRLRGGRRRGNVKIAITHRSHIVMPLGKKDARILVVKLNQTVSKEKAHPRCPVCGRPFETKVELMEHEKKGLKA